MRSMKNALIVTLIALSFMVTGCKGEASTTEKQEQARSSLMDKANASVPIPRIDNFLARQSVAEYMRRMDNPSKTFYIYVLGDNGNTIGYYVAKSQPMNICSFMSPTDKVEERYGDPDVVRQAPALDGLYYGSSGCNVDYFFDAETDALIQLNGLNYMITDQPLKLDAKPLKVQSAK
jgi:hypothetical protein